MLRKAWLTERAGTMLRAGEKWRERRMQSKIDRQIAPNWLKQLMKEFNKQTIKRNQACDNLMVLWSWQRECICETKIFYLWLNEWMSIDKRLSFFFVCLGEQGRVRERAETKAFLSVCVLSCPFFPGQRSGEASYFWLLSGWGERQRQQGAAVFCEVPWLPHTRPLIQLGFLGQPSLPLRMYVWVRVRVCVCQRENTWKWGCNWRSKGHKWWNKQWNLSGRMKWEATLNQGFCSLPLSLF